jgi:pyridoxal phosphate enzyme (YggS family)
VKLLGIESNIAEIKKNIPAGVTLLAVTKTRSVEEMKLAYNSGILDFGENKVQEFLDKEVSFGNDIRWHLIGHLQRNKVKYIVGKVWLIHSLDSIKLLEEIEKQFSKISQEANTLIEINIGREISKSGILEESLDLLLEAVERCKFVKVKGLMAIIPKENEELCRAYFKKMRQIWEDLKAKPFKNVSMEYLSMGMTNDYKIAILEGSNIIRIGEGIFGKRK